MEYRKDKRTKNLTLRDIHVGDWVQVWSEQTERYSPPLKITQICDDGTIYLVTSDEERPTPWEEDIKNVDALPITPELLKGFGFGIKKQENTYLIKGFNIFWSEERLEFCELKEYDGIYEIVTFERSFKYYNSFQHYLADVITIKTEWKGIEK